MISDASMIPLSTISISAFFFFSYASGIQFQTLDVSLREAATEFPSWGGKEDTSQKKRMSGVKLYLLDLTAELHT